MTTYINAGQAKNPSLMLDSLSYAWRGMVVTAPGVGASLYK